MSIQMQLWSIEGDRPVLLPSAKLSLEARLEQWICQDHLRKWKEGPSVFLLYFTDALYLILPKRCFSADQIDAIRQTLKRHVRQFR